MNCNNINPDFVDHLPDRGRRRHDAGSHAAAGICRHRELLFVDGEASLAVKRELAQGPVITSLVGYTLSYNTLDSNKNPTKGTLDRVQAGFRRRRRRRQFRPHDRRCLRYHEVLPDVVGLVHLQGGQSPDGAAKACACSTISRWARTWSADLPRRASDRAI